MSSSPEPPTVIIFGATGNIGSHAARTAHSLGANVILAMRDPSKPIPGIPLPSSASTDTATTDSQPSPTRYHRVQADLNDPASITSTPAKWHAATAAFVYLAMGSPDSMLSTFRALKSVGVKLVVLLSSFTIGSAPWLGDATKIPPGELIAAVHGRAEGSLGKVFDGADGCDYVAVRPGGFATNVLRNREGIVQGKVRLKGGAFRSDLITPEDMGAVCGELVVNGPKDGQKVVYLFGPQVIQTSTAIEVAARVLGRDSVVVEEIVDQEEALRQFVEEQGIPRPFAEYLVRKVDEAAGTKDEDQRPDYEEGVRNVMRYTGRESMGFEEWVGKNKARFEE